MPTRREMLKTIGLAVAGPAAVGQALAGGRWVVSEWRTQAFDWGTALGVCLSITHTATGEVRRNAVRIRTTRATREHLRHAEGLLLEWLKDQNRAA